MTNLFIPVSVDLALSTFRSGQNTPLKIMPLGDSLTLGVQSKINRDSGGYRPELWQKLVSAGLRVKFVGSQSSGPEYLLSQAHEGHPGWTIEQITNSVSAWLNTYQPDMILLIIGTNDTKRSTINRMIDQLGKLIDRIIADAPKAQLLIASIPPVHPRQHSLIRIVRTIAFNRAIPWLIHRKAQSKTVRFVDMTRLTVNDLTSSLPLGFDNGIHPHGDGYSKMANLWYESIMKAVSDRPPLIAPIKPTYFQFPLRKRYVQNC